MNEFPTLRVGEPVPEGWLEYLHDLLGQPMRSRSGRGTRATEVRLEVEGQRPDGTKHVTATNGGVFENDHAFYVQGPVGVAGPGGVYKALMWLPQEWGRTTRPSSGNHVPQ